MVVLLRIRILVTELREQDMIKVSKLHKQIFLFSFQPKNERDYFLISDLASKNWLNQKDEGSLLYQLFNILCSIY